MRTAIAVAAWLVLMLAGSANSFAAITETSGDVTLAPLPLSVVPGDQESNAVIIAFDELQHVTLAAPIAVDISSAGMYDETADLTPGTIPALRTVDSHFLHLDPVGGTQVELEGSVTFQTRILGVIVLAPTLNTSDNTLGYPFTEYPPGWPGRGVDLDSQPDWIHVDDDLRTVTVHLHEQCVVDQIRVITAGEDDVISNLTALQRPDTSGQVDVDYTLNLADPNSTAVISMEVSANGGSYVAVTAVSGDVGAGVPPGTGRHIVWDPAVDFPGVGGSITVRLTADGRRQPSGGVGPIHGHCYRSRRLAWNGVRHGWLADRGGDGDDPYAAAGPHEFEWRVCPFGRTCGLHGGNVYERGLPDNLARRGNTRGFDNRPERRDDRRPGRSGPLGRRGNLTVLRTRPTRVLPPGRAAGGGVHRRLGLAVLVHRFLRDVRFAVAPYRVSCDAESQQPGRQDGQAREFVGNPPTARLAAARQVGHAARHRVGPIRRGVHPQPGSQRLARPRPA